VCSCYLDSDCGNRKCFGRLFIDWPKPGRGWRVSESNRSVVLAVLVALMAALAVSCATRQFNPEPLDSVNFTSRSLTQSEDGVRVRAAVPSPEEAEAIFGFPIYDSRIQPVWLEVENGAPYSLRYAPVGTDSLYFSPLEVA
jgi:hypothetical protein